jgi:hypothetical protein
MVSNISLIQANMQHSIATSRVPSRTVSVKGIDMALNTGTVVLQGPYYGPEYSTIYLFYASGCSTRVE